MEACNTKNSNQNWTLYPGGQIKHDNLGLCLDMGEGHRRHYITVEKCDGSYEQIWEFERYGTGKQFWRPL